MNAFLKTQSIPDARRRVIGMLCMILFKASIGFSQDEPIGLYDLTPTLQFDHANPAQVAAAWDLAHAVSTLQGIVNRDAPRLYLRFVSSHGKDIDDYWLRVMRARGQWLEQRRFEKIRNLDALIKRYRSLINGVIVYDERVPATSNLASTLAGVHDTIAVRYDASPGSLYQHLVHGRHRLPVIRQLLNDDGSPMFTGEGAIPETDLPTTGSAKCDAYLWLKVNYVDAGKVDAGYVGYYIDAFWLRNPAGAHPNHHTLTNHDFFVAKRGFFFDLGPWADERPIDDSRQPLGADLSTMKALLLSAYEQAGKERMIHVGGFTPWAYKYTTHGRAGGTHEPVPTEWEYAKIVSAYNGFIDADAIGFGAMANASFYMHFPLQKKYFQKWISTNELQEQGYLDALGQVDFRNREFMLFYVGDYDSAPWVYQFMPVAWEHPARGKLPLMWCISPVIERRAPMALDYLRRTATTNDYFVAADNGAGYLNPGMLQEPRPISELPSGLDAWARHCKPLYDRWDISITGFVIDGYAPGLNTKGLDCYASFSPNGIVPQNVPASLLHGDMPVLRADHDLGDSIDGAVAKILELIDRRHLPFHWFRGVLKTPDWYEEIYKRVRAANPNVELLPAPTFFELYRTWLKQTPDAAAGRIPFE